MGSAHLYFPGDRLSSAELSAACLDGHLISVGDAYMPADAVETAALRAGSIAPLLGEGLAATGLSAAWIHGATAGPPARHSVQRIGARRRHHVIDLRLDYHDTPLDQCDILLLGGVRVTTVARTVTDLLRADSTVATTTAQQLLEIGAVTPADALLSLERSGPLPGKRRARTTLRTWIAGAAQLDVTR
ncbi:hypothetical protein PU630_08125 [Microbacterium horticulturae]|uniref:AbiEi antitoxin C-terminal domain-containing protein n=1 Tax=Microbacterium horticulturae TaxID=3028316 RepID=A0ABY8C207_9MICO|nr:hypothetical protein [Microbacterium sp. KACC 23027]WEG10491.1 hypothetical protein PU630_08125 [Microbacterium sp. KACC 23027]